MIRYLATAHLKVLKKFFQWLWMDKKPILHRPEYAITKIINPTTFIARREHETEECGMRIQLFWNRLKQRFIDSYIVRRFHKIYYDSNAWIGCWKGIRILKCPTDLFVYQEIIYETKPDIIIECGTANGGTAIYLADICDIMGKGKVATIDFNPDRHPELDQNTIFRPYHDRILYIVGDDTSKEVIDLLKEVILKDDSVMVILDSDHQKDHVFKQLEIYSEFVTDGQYMIVEDTDVGYRVQKQHKNDGPIVALDHWLKYHPEFRIDYTKEKHLLTSNLCGYLKKDTGRVGK